MSLNYQSPPEILLKGSMMRLLLPRFPIKLVSETLLKRSIFGYLVTFSWIRTRSGYFLVNLEYRPNPTPFIIYGISATGEKLRFGARPRLGFRRTLRWLWVFTVGGYYLLARRNEKEEAEAVWFPRDPK